MQQCYDWQSNVLKFTDVNGNKYNLKFRGNKTIVHGDSATGKSLLCTMLKSYINDNNNASFKPYNADNIFIVSKDNKDKLSLQKGKLIIIDRAELILDEQMVEIIKRTMADLITIVIMKSLRGESSCHRTISGRCARRMGNCSWNMSVMYGGGHNCCISLQRIQIQPVISGNV